MTDDYGSQMGPTAEQFKHYVSRRNSLKPEQRVLDDIEELVNEELTHTPDDYHMNNQRYDKCELCQGLWHGLPGHNGCPGAYATEEQAQLWVESTTRKGEYFGYATTEYQGVLCSVHLYRDEHGGFSWLLTPRIDEEHGRGFDCDLYTFDEGLSTLTVNSVHEGVALPITYAPQGIPNLNFGLDTP